jgi:hypothetical protein
MEQTEATKAVGNSGVWRPLYLTSSFLMQNHLKKNNNKGRELIHTSLASAPFLPGPEPRKKKKENSVMGVLSNHEISRIANCWFLRSNLPRNSLNAFIVESLET